MLVRLLVVYQTACLLLNGVQALALNVAIPLSPPSTATPIAPDHVSFSLEQDRWLDWVGSTSRNEFFYTTLDNLRQLTGAPPQIRIGANSEDHTNFNPSIEFVQTVFPAPSANVPYPEASSIIVGDGYYAATRFLPNNTRVIWGLNLGQNNLTAAYLMAQSITKAFASTAINEAGIILEAIQIGNEPDLYPNNGLRPSNYNVSQHVQEWRAFASNVTNALAISSSSRTKFWGAGFATSSHSKNGFSPQGLFSQELTSSSPGSLISTLSQHRYSGSFCSGDGALLQDLMTKSSIRGNLSNLASDIAATRAQGLDYVMGETNSFACHGTPGVSNVAGAALWTLDYLLFASQAGISRIFFHQGIGFKYNLIQPATLTRSPTDGKPLATPLPPHVQPQYYAAIIAGEAIGSSGNTRIAELTANDPRISGYGFYEEGTLVRAVFINSLACFASDSGTRPVTHVNLTFDGSSPAPKAMTVKRLVIPHADDASGLTWGGRTYETSDGRASGKLSVKTVNVAAGFDLQATEAVLLSFTSDVPPEVDPSNLD